MRKPWLWMLLSGLIGIGAAWLITHYRYGAESRFGPFGGDGQLTASTAVAHMDSLTPSDGNPKAVVADGQTSYDFGIMKPGSKGEHTFVIANEGQSNLDLRLGASTCKCTLGDLENESVKPGTSTRVTLSWTVKPNDVSFSQSAQVLTNDPANPALTFAIVGKVVRDFDVVPQEWTFGDVSAVEPFEVSGTIYSFLDNDIEPVDPVFSSPDLTELTEFTVESFKPTDEGYGIHASARQGFRVQAKVAPGLRQGPLFRKLIFGYHKLDSQGNRIINSDAAGDAVSQVSIPVSGSLVGPLSMILNEDLKEVSGAYVYDLGRIGKNDPLTANAFVVLKGREHDNVKLRIGETSPEGVIKAKLGEPRGTGSTKLFPLEIELIPGTESVERRGLNEDDYGWIWIESDTPKVSRMRVALKFSLDGR